MIEKMKKIMRRWRINEQHKQSLVAMPGYTHVRVNQVLKKD